MLEVILRAMKFEGEEITTGDVIKILKSKQIRPAAHSYILNSEIPIRLKLESSAQVFPLSNS